MNHFNNYWHVRIFILILTCFSCNNIKPSIEKFNFITSTTINESKSNLFYKLPKEIIIKDSLLYANINMNKIGIFNIYNGNLIDSIILSDTLYDVLVKLNNNLYQKSFYNKKKFDGLHESIPYFNINSIVLIDSAILSIAASQNLLYEDKSNDTILEYLLKYDFIFNINLENNKNSFYPVKNQPNISVISYSGYFKNKNQIFFAIQGKNSNAKLTVGRYKLKNDVLVLEKSFLDSFIEKKISKAYYYYAFESKNNVLLFIGKNFIVDTNSKMIHSLGDDAYITNMQKLSGNTFLVKVEKNEKNDFLYKVNCEDIKNLQISKIEGIKNIGTFCVIKDTVYNLIKKDEKIILEKYIF
jgi:hypothetical protein